MIKGNLNGEIEDMKSKTSLARIAGIAMLTSLASFPLQAQQSDEVFGRELMTQQELREHRQTMQNLNSGAERQQYLQRHRELMLERARERGVDLRQGNGRGPGMGNNQPYKQKGSGGQGG